MITTKTLDNGIHVFAGDNRIAIITDETPKAAVDKFIELANARANELTELSIEYEAKRQWNFASKGHGKNWPVFAKRDRIISQLCKQAGIVDS